MHGIKTYGIKIFKEWYFLKYEVFISINSREIDESDNKLSNLEFEVIKLVKVSGVKWSRKFASSPVQLTSIIRGKFFGKFFHHINTCETRFQHNISLWL